MVLYTISESRMMQMLLRRRYIPIYTGLALGAASAYYVTRRNYSKVQSDSPNAISLWSYTDLSVKEIESISHNVKKITFDLPIDRKLGAKVTSMVLFKHVDENGKSVTRPYTPISTPETLGEATFAIKHYPDGKMSSFLHSLKVGDKVSVKGPIGKYTLNQNQHEKIALLGGGTGITPLFQILQKVAEDPSDKTNVHLFYANNTVEDIVLRKEIDALVAKKPNQLKVTYFVSKPDETWKGEVGHITKEYLESHMFKPSENNVKIFVCGPPGFYKAVSGEKSFEMFQGGLNGILKDLSFSKNHVYKF